MVAFKLSAPASSNSCSKQPHENVNSGTIITKFYFSQLIYQRCDGRRRSRREVKTWGERSQKLCHHNVNLSLNALLLVFCYSSVSTYGGELLNNSINF